MLLGEIFGPDLLIVVLLVAVLIFGGSAIPKFARSLGQAKNEFEKGMSTVKDASETITNAATISEMNVPRTSE
ncbi:MAG: twin-arginine translocase TatA/TatE family subunit [Acidimicrobiales bacterium]|jgi:sec-independent protein translocase protein TatA